MATKKTGALERFMASLRAELMQAARPLPMLLTAPAAAEQLSIGMTKLNEIIKSGRLKTVSLGVGKRGKPGHPMVPRSELERLTSVRDSAPAPTRSARRRLPATADQKPATRAGVEELLKRKLGR